ncbi:hypothetical protein ACFOLJ_16910 [Rugamonas sp. CCM 8940]|uniref:hypothetical protein n=1 Tax=Rugamonas sp. CCM 8940 TaxID=2765359 RepID=UPI0018F691A3|nr:hypothetical protein [Rugamonas sp. CCM 8940]MBJ7311068.1 hypothetical protein [Rugamonas sp. CCM 8940]
MTPRSIAALRPTLLSALLGAALLAAAPARAETLETPSYTIVIKSHCVEGSVGCDNVGYTGTSKKSGKAIRLSGKTLHTTCADGVTPCRFIGYEFKNGAVSYTVTDGGDLIVKSGRKVVLQEHGEWK